MTKVYLADENDFAPVSQGVHDAVCCEYKDLGTQDTMYGPKHQGVWVFQVRETHDSGNYEGQRKEIRAYFNLANLGTLSRPSNLLKWMQKWRGRPYTAEELTDGLDPEAVVGYPCRLDIIHKTTQKGDLRARVDNVLPPGEVKLQPSPEYVPLDAREKTPDPGAASVNAVKDQAPW